MVTPETNTQREALLRIFDSSYMEVFPTGLTPVHMTLPGYDSSIGGSDE